jgi:hypothetical protein
MTSSWPQCIGVCGDDERALPLLRELTARGVALLVVRQTPDWDAQFRGWPRVAFRTGWDALLAEPECAEVLVGGSDETTLQAVRHLAQGGKTVWLLPHPAQGLMFAYELSLQLAEGQGLVVPVFPLRADPACQRLLAAARAGLIHDLRYLECERYWPGARLTAADAARQLFGDLDLLERLAGPYSRVTTLRTGDSEGLLQQTVTLASTQGSEAVWTIKPAQTACVFRLTLHTAHGVWQLEQNGDLPAAWRMPPPAHLLAGPSRTQLEVLLPREAAAEAWRDAVTVFELADAVEHSWERRRTIDLHHEPLSERTIFKTQMAAIGCGVLLLTLLLLLGYLALASTVPLSGGVLHVLRAVVFAPVVLFLLAQLLLPLTRPAKTAGRDG